MSLHRIDNRPIPRSSGECRAFVVCNNEVERLPYLFDYHRRLGVQRFIVVDNNSNDGSYDFLASQPDCHLFHTAESFAAARYGVNWINCLLEDYGMNNWCLVLDADELFVYPHSEEIPLPEFCAYLDRSGSQGVVAYLLDMYSRGPISQARYTPGTPFFDTCPYFDRDYLIRSRFGFSVGNWPWPDIEVVGGPRLRCFYSGLQGASRIKTNLPKAVRRAKRSGIGRSLRIDRLQLGSDVPPLLTKVPLVKGGNGLQYVNNHKPKPVPLAPETGALLHFKYFADFYHRVEQAVTAGEHYDGASEYALYRNVLRTQPEMGFFYEGSQRYRGTPQLIDLGLIRTTPALEQWRESRSRESNETRTRVVA
jgi:hypothetical protein